MLCMNVVYVCLYTNMHWLQSFEKEPMAITSHARALILLVSTAIIVTRKLSFSHEYSN